MIKSLLLGSIMSVVGLVGCATSPLTQEDVHDIVESCQFEEPCVSAAIADREAYIREERRIKRREDVVNFVHRCEAQEKVLVNTCKQCRASEARKRARDKTYIPSDWHLSDLQCGTPREVMDALKRAGF